jgi:predicted Rossmann fold flavoprotein
LIAKDSSGSLRTLTGISQQAEIALWIDGSIAQRLRGSLLWTHFGLSGPVVLDMSRHWLRARLEHRNTRVTINLVADQSFESLEQNWISRATRIPRSSVQSVVSTMMPAAVAAAILERVGLDGSTLIGNLPRADRRRLTHALTEWPANIVDSRGYNYAEATAGGVSLDEIDPATMQSRRCPGLYLVGEMLDVDGRIGGFNFQWAWCSARVAGRALALVGGI